MEPRVEMKTEAAVVHLSGELRGPDDGAISPTIESLLDSANPRIVIDLSGVSYVSSAGLGELVQLVSRANSQSARMVLCAPSPFVSGVLKATRLDKFFEILPTTAAALSALR